MREPSHIDMHRGISNRNKQKQKGNIGKGKGVISN